MTQNRSEWSSECIVTEALAFTLCGSRRWLAGLVLATAALAVNGQAGDGNRPPAVVASNGDRGERVVETYADLPLSFVENRGQLKEPVRYYAQRPGYGLAFMDDQVVLALRRQAGASSQGQPASGGLALALRFVDSNPDAAPEGEGRAPGTTSYLRGRDPAGWQTGLPSYRGVAYRGLWPGVDMVLHGREGELKYLFRVRPGADSKDICLAYAGAEDLALEADGSLRIETPLGALRDSPPVTWQDIGGRRVTVESRYVLQEDGRYGFAVAEHDPDYELVIDPGLDYSTFLGGSNGEHIGDIAVDADGSAYIVGHTTSDDFPTTPGAFDRTFNGGVMDVFVAKLSPDGSSLEYSTYLGGTPAALRRGTESAQDNGYGIAVDADGHAYITGATSSDDFPTTSGAFQPSINATDNSAIDAFVAKLDSSGSGLVYSTFVGGGSQDFGRSIAIDGSGNAYITGETCATDFPTTAGAFQTSRGDGCAAFLTKVNANGSGLVYSTYLGGSDNSIADRVVVDGAGHAYVVGSSRAEDFPTTPGAFMPVHPGGEFADLFTAFALKASIDGSGLVYSTFLGGTKRDFGADLVIDSDGHAYLSGSTMSEEFPTTAGAFDTTFTGTSEGFLAKLTPDGSGLVFSTFLGDAAGLNLALDSANNIWLAGGTSSANAPTTEDAFSDENSGGTDVWFGLMSGDGSAILFGSYFGGGHNENAQGIALGADESVYLVGTTRSFDFPTTQGAFQSTLASTDPETWADAFALKFGSGTGEVEPAPPPSTTTESFSARLRKGDTHTHSITIGGTGTVDVHLDWDEPRSDLTLRVEGPDGNVVFLDDSSDLPKSGSFQAEVTGTYTFAIINEWDRHTDYILTVTYPDGESSSNAILSFVSLDPESVTGGETSTGQVALSSGAPSGGADVELISSNPDVAQVPSVVTIQESATSTEFTVTTNSVEVNTAVTIAASYNGSTEEATLEVLAEEGTAVSALALDPNPVSGGGSSTGTVTLTAAAPAGGAEVALVSSNTEVATVPSSVTVAEGATSATFTASAAEVTVDSSSAITASHGGESRTVILSVTVNEEEPEPTALSSLALDPNPVSAGGSSTGTVTLTAAAPAGGAEVALTSSNTEVATVPSSVTVAEGATSATFTASAAEVTADSSSAITASHGGESRTVTLSVLAPEDGDEEDETDTVRITRAEYRSDKEELRVEAESSSSSATLEAYETATDTFIGTLDNEGGGEYEGRFDWSSTPEEITVKSSLGGSDTVAVDVN